jgi:hypothetical protein
VVEIGRRLAERVPGPTPNEWEFSMYVSIHHDIHDPDLFKEKVNQMSPPPRSLRRHQFLTAVDLRGATCLWEAPSVDELRDYIDPQLEPASTQRYLAVNAERAIGLPMNQSA